MRLVRPRHITLGILAVAPLTAPGAEAQTATGTGTPAHHHHHRHAPKNGGAPAGVAAGQTGVALPGTRNASAVAHSASGGTVAAAAMGNEAIIVTGTRDLNKRARDSTSPIDVVTAAALTRTGLPNLASALTTVNASIDQQEEGADTAALVSSIRLRGLSPNQTLVLLDGVRRHQTANITADAGPEQGATPVDLNMIPAAAIDHIEILRDGAAAQYGSDAIAGVANVILKTTSFGTSATATTGANAYNGDGWLYQLDWDQGVPLGADGYLHLGGQVYHADHFVTSATDDRTGADDNPISSTPEETRETFSLNAGGTLFPDIAGGVEGFSLITYGHRHAEAFENYRLPSVIPQVYPEGFVPIETDEENDYAATLGLRGSDLGGFRWSVSTTYGEDDVNIGNKNTANPNLYYLGDLLPSNSADPNYGERPGYTPTKVFAQSQTNGQWTNNLDLNRLFHVGAMPLNLAFGAEQRLDRYFLGDGDPASWEVGGTQGFAGLRPQNAGAWNRDVYAGYVETDLHPTPKLDVDLAGRYEHYTDFGNTETGKLSSRYDFTKWIAVRGTISNGFRAPTLAEEHFSALNVSPTGASGDLAVNSAAARSIGAVPLKPERSTNESAGLVVEPLPRMSVTFDVYQINIRDRIVGAGGVVGPDAINAIALAGASLPANITPSDVSAYYFANGASTRTQGADLDVSYFTPTENYGSVLWTVSMDLNRTRIHHVGTDGNGNPFLTAQGIGYLTTAFPRSKLILDALWRYRKWDVNFRQTRYGQTTDDLTYEDQAPPALQYSGTQFYEFKQTPAWLTDLEVGYKLSAHWHAAVGADNIFNILPRRLPPEVNYLGSNVYDGTSSQIGITGGFYYGRVNYTF